MASWCSPWACFSSAVGQASSQRPPRSCSSRHISCSSHALSASRRTSTAPASARSRPDASPAGRSAQRLAGRPGRPHRRGVHPGRRGGPGHERPVAVVVARSPPPPLPLTVALTVGPATRHEARRADAVGELAAGRATTSARARRPSPWSLGDGSTTHLRRLSADRPQLLLHVSETARAARRSSRPCPSARDSCLPSTCDWSFAPSPERPRLTERVEPLSVHDPEGLIGETFDMQPTPSAVLLGSDGLLAGGPVVGATPSRTSSRTSSGADRSHRAQGKSSKPPRPAAPTDGHQCRERVRRRARAAG